MHSLRYEVDSLGALILETVKNKREFRWPMLIDSRSESLYQYFVRDTETQTVCFKIRTTEETESNLPDHSFESARRYGISQLGVIQLLRSG